MNTSNNNTETIPVGVVGLGLMGCSITTCLLLAGHPVIAIAPIPADMATAGPRISEHLAKSKEEGLTSSAPGFYLNNLTITEDYGNLKDCLVVIECTIENIEIKKTVYARIEGVVAESAIITSNTSAIPISILQSETRVPERFLGLHWAEPSHTTRFLEIICGNGSDIAKAEWLYDLSNKWGKECCMRCFYTQK